jgi:hypothetical protein
LNPLIKKHLEQVNERLDDIQDVLAQSDKRVAQAERQRQEVLEAQLRQRKELVTLQHKGSTFDSLNAQNQDLLQRTNRLREGLRKLLQLTKALSGELRQ